MTPDPDRPRDLRARSAMLFRMARDTRDMKRKEQLIRLADSASDKADQLEATAEATKAAIDPEAN